MLQTWLWLRVKQALSIRPAHAMVKDGLKISSTQNSLTHARRLVNHFSAATLKEQQVNNRMSTPLLPTQDVATRWNSQPMMAERLLLLRLLLAILFNSPITKLADRGTLHLPETAWEVLEDIVPVLRPLAAATQLLTAEKIPTTSQIYIILRYSCCNLMSQV